MKRNSARARQPGFFVNVTYRTEVLTLIHAECQAVGSSDECSFPLNGRQEDRQTGKQADRRLADEEIGRQYGTTAQLRTARHRQGALKNHRNGIVHVLIPADSQHRIRIESRHDAEDKKQTS